MTKTLDMIFPEDARQEIYKEASKRLYRYTHCIRGNTITEQDSLDYWILNVTVEKMLNMR